MNEKSQGVQSSVVVKEHYVINRNRYRSNDIVIQLTRRLISTMEKKKSVRTM